MSLRTELRQLGCSPNVVTKLVSANKAFERIKTSRLWEDWIEIGRAIEDAHEDMMRRLHLNSTNGMVHNQPWGEILRVSGFDQISAPDRHALGICVKRFDEITAWRESMNEIDRSRYNHPRRVLEHFLKDETAKQAGAKADPFTGLGDAVKPEIGDNEDDVFADPVARLKRGRRARNASELEHLQEQLDAAYRSIADKDRIIALLEAQLAELRDRLARIEGRDAAPRPPLPH